MDGIVFVVFSDARLRSERALQTDRISPSAGLSPRGFDGSLTLDRIAIRPCFRFPSHKNRLRHFSTPRLSGMRLTPFPASPGSVDLIITSPPYWGYHADSLTTFPRQEDW